MSQRPVKIYQVPALSTQKSEQALLQHLQQSSGTERPRFVLDCSSIWNMDVSMIQLLLSCLEEAMRYNGDVRLAALSSEAEADLRRAGVGRLFEIYGTTENAVRSFHQRATSMAPLAFENEVFGHDSEYAA